MAWGLRRIGATEINEWLAFFELEPFGPGRDDLRAGVIACMLSSKSGAVPEDFFPNLKVELDPEEARERRDAQILEALTGLTKPPR